MCKGVRVNRIGVGMSNRQLFSIGLVLVAYTTGTISSAAEQNKPEAVEIPLDKIWAWDMPGTTSIRSLEPENFGDVLKGKSSAEQLRLQESSLLSETLVPLAKFSKARCGPGFAVKGTGKEALKNARAVLAGGESVSKSFTPQDEVSLVFFSRLFGAYVHLTEVKRAGNSVEIRYQFEPHLDSELTVNFALIPLGKLPVGKVDVKVIRVPHDKKFDVMSVAPVSKENEARVVCKSFRFEVEDGH